MEPAQSPTLLLPCPDRPDPDLPRRSRCSPPSRRPTRTARPARRSIWYRLEDDGRILINSRVTRFWPANLQRDGRVSLAVIGTDGVRLGRPDRPRRRRRRRPRPSPRRHRGPRLAVPPRRTRSGRSGELPRLPADHVPDRDRPRPRPPGGLTRWPPRGSATRRCSSSSGRRRSSATRRPPRRPGFSGVMAADHFQPWVPQQGNAAFVWNVMTAIAERTKGDVGPGVTCPTFRMHPAIVAQAVGDARGDVPGPALAGSGQRRGAQRARRRRLLARDARADQPDVRGDRDHQASCSAAAAATSSTTASTSSSRSTRLWTLPEDAAADLHRDRRAGDRQEDRACTRTG